MFEFMLFAAACVALLGLIAAFDGSRDVFHPLVFIAPMMAFLYGWMPWKLLQQDGLSRFFDGDQLRHVQMLNLFGVMAFVGACLLVGTRVKRPRSVSRPLPERTAHRLLMGGAVLGSLGLLCWGITIVNVGGFEQAFSTSYSGGWDPSGYVRDGSLMLLLGVLLALNAISAGGPKLIGLLEVVIFGTPWLISALLMGRRGPTFGLCIILLMGWYFNRSKRPPILLIAAGGACLGWLVLFLVTNRSQLYLGSDFKMNDDVSHIVDTPDTGNEFIYGTGTVLSSERRDHYFWMRRYLAEILVRPIPSAIWPTKYEDFGVPELLFNAGTGEGFGDTLGWVGAVGSAPGLVADLFVEVWWFAIVAMAALGWLYGFVWRRAVLRGGPWATQFTILSCLSIYLVMQTVEAILFRTLMLSIPAWLVWRWAQAPVRVKVRKRLVGGRLQRGPLPRLRPSSPTISSSVASRITSTISSSSVEARHV